VIGSGVWNEALKSLDVREGAGRQARGHPSSRPVSQGRPGSTETVKHFLAPAWRRVPAAIFRIAKPADAPELFVVVGESVNMPRKVE
jgi:hypothetical protein